MMGASDPNKRRLIWAGAVFAPLLTVQVVRVFDGGGPSSAPAAVVTESEELPGGLLAAEGTGAARPMSEAQKRAIAFVSAYQPSEGLRSPMDRADPAPEAVEDAGPAVEEPSEPPVDALAGLSVSTIMGRDESAVAMIGHRLRRVGDEVAPGWRVRLIDPRNRRVVLSGPDGQEVTMTPPAPAMRG